jgi:TIR domain
MAIRLSLLRGQPHNMAENTQGRAIFISYRRDDTEGEAGRLYDDLVRAYSDNNVFMDVSGIQPGLDFRKAIDDNVSGCGVLLAVIGPTWGTVTGKDGARRLDNADDYVRLEIGSALKRGIPVIPVLVHEAHMPTADLLPEDLKDLRYRNSVELTHARWNSDVALLIGALKSYVTVNTSTQTETVHATVPVQLPAPQPAAPAEPAAKSKLPLWIGVGAAAVIVLAIAIFVVMRPKPAPAPANIPVPSPTSVSAPTASTTPASQPTTTPSATTSSQPAPGGNPRPPTTIPATDTPFLGKWKAAKEPTGADNLARLEIVDYEGKPMVSAWGKRPDSYPSWGSQRASVRGNELVTDTWEPRFTPQEKNLQRSVTLSIVTSGDGLQVTVKNRYRQPSGETNDVYNQIDFVKVP